MRYISVAIAAEQLGVQQRRVQRLCRDRRIPGAHFVGRVWRIPANFAVTPGARGPKPHSK